jgi:hypothetical protein
MHGSEVKLEPSAPIAAGSSAAPARHGRMRVAGLALLYLALLYLVSPGFLDPGVSAQEVRAQHRWRMAMEGAALTAEQETAQAARPGSQFRECANGCPAMIVIPAGKFIMGSPESEPDRNASEDRQGVPASDRGRMGVRGASRHADALLLGR